MVLLSFSIHFSSILSRPLPQGGAKSSGNPVPPAMPHRASLCLSVKEPWWYSGWNRPAGGTKLTAKTNTKWTRRGRGRGLLGSSRHQECSEPQAKSKLWDLVKRDLQKAKHGLRRGEWGKGEVGTLLCPQSSDTYHWPACLAYLWGNHRLGAGVRRPNGKGTIRGSVPGGVQGSPQAVFTQS